jgi:hypothetical protein
VRIALDFDGVLCDPGAVDPGHVMGRPVELAADALEILHDKGHEIIVHTVRANTIHGRDAVRDWLEYFMPGLVSRIVGKPDADVYLDDKALQFTSLKFLATWPEVLDGLS